jgi:hypothetical protein
MNITAAKISGKEIHEKYPILNTKWKYSNREYDWNGYDGYYYSNYKDWSTEVVTDPWYRAFKDYVPISDDDMSTLYHTTVEGNPVLLLMYKKTYV